MTVSPLATTQCHELSSTVMCTWPMRGDTVSAPLPNTGTTRTVVATIAHSVQAIIAAR
jgi:hypothetical protein